jgi:hypothetical protein
MKRQRMAMGAREMEREQAENLRKKPLAKQGQELFSAHRTCAHESG